MSKAALAGLVVLVVASFARACGGATELSGGGGGSESGGGGASGSGGVSGSGGGSGSGDLDATADGDSASPKCPSCEWDKFCCSGVCVPVSEFPVLFSVEPSTVYNGVATEVTIYGAILGAINELLLVECVPPQTVDQVALEFEIVSANQINAIVPSNLLPGTCSLRMNDTNGCAIVFGDALHISDNP